MNPFNEFDLRSFKIIEILGTSSEIKKHCMGWLISTKRKYKIMRQIIRSSYFKTFDTNKKLRKGIWKKFLDFSRFLQKRKVHR